MASPSDRPQKKQTTPHNFFQAANGSSQETGSTQGTPNPDQPEVSSSLKKRPAAEVIVIDNSDEDAGLAGAGREPDARRKRAKTGATDAADVSDHLDEGEIGESGSGYNPSVTTSEAAGPSLKSHQGWNHGVSNGLRISFGAKTQVSNPPPGQTAPGDTLEKTSDTVSTPPSEPSGSSRSGMTTKKTRASKKGKKASAKLSENAGKELDGIDGIAAREEAAESIAGEGSAKPPSPSPVVSTQSTPVLSYVEEKPGERERYFPGIGQDEIFCVMCTSHAHTVDACPHLVCGICQSATHRTIACGLKKTASTELCRLCQASQHLENVCEKVWRTYEPEPDRIHKVNNLTAYCYQCGEEGHYGLDCAQLPASGNGSSWRTWTVANLLMYLDEDSSEQAVSASFPSDAAAAPSGRPNFGKSIVPQRHVLFEAADDDDDDAFIRPLVQRNPRPGGIAFQTGGGNFVPPLPPGPPPPLPSGPPPSAPLGDNRRKGGKHNYRKNKGKKSKRF
ncbi:hypothetical protein B0T14DRAFT_293838 [Immersiella caudata]|uniref:CCHC-type domain-containing protein n=1 Tax=Immersiella caudata TaxID=314043 RepID=A0AA40BUF5_9PEZI|nr:hypothetical protein B0T14DRAFT_293838 [Immersiella caudata]